MRKDEFFEVLEGIDDDFVKGAKTGMEMKKKINWKAWGGAAAACLCLAAGAAIISYQSKLSYSETHGIIPAAGVGGAAVGDGGAELGGNNESVMYSVAVYPDFESETNVASAEVVSLTESEALGNALAVHLPKELPEGFHFGRGSVYNTVMKDGTQYNMLMVEYITGAIPEQEFAEDGGAIMPDPNAIGDSFTVQVLNFEPRLDISIFSSTEEVTVSAFEENSYVYVSFGEHYVGVFKVTAEAAAALEALKSIS